MLVFQEFYNYCNFEKLLNATFVTLVPKKSGAINIKDFHPISLIAKSAGHSIESNSQIFVSATQNAFVIGRQILDLGLIAYKSLHNT